MNDSKETKIASWEVDIGDGSLLRAVGDGENWNLEGTVAHTSNIMKSCETTPNPTHDQFSLQTGQDASQSSLDFEFDEFIHGFDGHSEEVMLQHTEYKGVGEGMQKNAPE